MACGTNLGHGHARGAHDSEFCTLWRHIIPYSSPQPFLMSPLGLPHQPFAPLFSTRQLIVVNPHLHTMLHGADTCPIRGRAVKERVVAQYDVTGGLHGRAISTSTSDEHTAMGNPLGGRGGKWRLINGASCHEPPTRARRRKWPLLGYR